MEADFAAGLVSPRARPERKGASLEMSLESEISLGVVSGIMQRGEICDPSDEQERDGGAA